MKNIKIILLILIVSLITPLEVFAQDNTLAGQNRFDTAIKISNTYQYSKEVILVNSNAIQDVLCATSLASSKNIPILLTDKSKLNENTLKEIIRLNSELVYIIGGESVIDKCVEEELDNTNINFKRISGKDRYETSIKVSKEINLCEDINNIAIVNGESICDAISISSVIKNMPIILSKKDDLGIAKEYIQSEDINKVYIIGGENSLSNNITTNIKDYKRIYGKDRYETNIKIIEEFTDSKKISKLYYCKGNTIKDEDLIDGLLISPKASNNSAVTLLINDEITDNQISLIKKLKVRDTIQVGREINKSIKNKIESLKVIEIKPSKPNNNKPQEPNETPNIKPEDKPNDTINPPNKDDENQEDNNENQEENEENKKGVIVNSDSELKKALKDKSVDIIRLGKDIILNNFGLNISRPVIIDGSNGNGKYTIDGKAIKSQAILIGSDNVSLKNLNIYGRKEAIIVNSASNVEFNNIKATSILKSKIYPAISIISSVVKVDNLELDSQYSGIEISYNNIINKLGLTIDKDVINLSKDDEGNYKPTIIIKDIDNIDKEQIINFGAYEEQYEYEVITNKDDTKDKIYYRKEDLTSN